MKILSTTVTLLAATLALSAAARAQGSDTCTTPTVISGVGPHAFDTSAATTGSQGQANAGCLYNGYTAIENDVWFRWTASAGGIAILSFCQQTLVDTKVAVYLATACPGAAPVACDDDGCGAQSLTSFIVNAGDTFVIQVGNATFASGGTGSFTIHMSPATSYNNCSTPEAISGIGEFPFDNRGATGTGPVSPGCVTVKQDVWYAWTAPTTGLARLELCGRTALDSNIAVWATACPGGSPSLACDDDACGLASQVMWPVSAGGVYILEVGSASSASTGFGTILLDVAGPPANDDCASASPIAGGAGFDNTLATTGSEGQANPCGGIDHDLWYTWTASVNGTATLDTCFQTGVDTSLAVYAGAGCPAGVALACDDDGSPCFPQSEVTFPVSSGATYTIQVGTKAGFPGGSGSFTIVETAGGPGTSYCVPGLAGVSACPCSNPPSPADRGCDNSSSTGGAQLTSTGTASLSSDSVVFTSSGEKPTATSIFLQGNVDLATGAVFGQGIRCPGGSLKRLYVHNAVGGVVSAPVGADPTVSARSAALGDTISPGTTRYYAVYYRDPTVLGGCPAASTFNVSQSQSVLWAP